MQHRIQRKRETYVTGTPKRAQRRLSLTAAKPPSTINTRGRVGSQRRTATIIWAIQSMLVLCRLPLARLVCSLGASTVKKGKAHIRGLHGTGTSSIMLTQRKPKLVTVRRLLERTASRKAPFCLILGPLRRSSVSSAAMTSGAPPARKATTKRPSRIWLRYRPDPAARG